MSTIAPAIVQLRAEVNAACPQRDRTSDGIIGDPRHEALGSASDHNAWLMDTYRAVDLDRDLQALPRWDAQALAEHIRQLGAAGDPRLVGGGYVIYNRRIASDSSGWRWVPYTGSNPHTEHIHVSVTRNPDGFRSAAPWGIAPSPAAAPTAASTPPLVIDGRLGLATVRALQTAVGVERDGSLGQITIKALQRRLGVAADGRLGPVSVGALQRLLGVDDDGRLGPVTIKALQRRLNTGRL